MMKVLKWIGIVVGAVVLIVGCFLAYVNFRSMPTYTPAPPNLHVEITPARIENGHKIVSLLCINCHYDQKTGRLSGKPMEDLPPQFGTAAARNITQDPEFGIGSWTDGDIAYLLRTGVKKNGIYAPPWMPKLPLMADEDLYSVIAFLRSNDTLVQATHVKDIEPQPAFLAKFLVTIGAFKPYEYPTVVITKPPVTDQVAYGRYLATGVVGCYSCHSADFAKMDELHPEKTVDFFAGGNEIPDASGRILHTPNLTMDKETGLGNWTEEQFINTLKSGIRADHTPLRYPMMRLPELGDSELTAIWSYLKTVPIIHKERIKSPADVASANASEGEKLYMKYACYGCHGNAGIGQCDLRGAYKKYHTNDELTAWIRDPSKTMPGSKMPTWNGTIQENEYGPLCEYVRLLGERSGNVAAK